MISSSGTGVLRYFGPSLSATIRLMSITANHHAAEQQRRSRSSPRAAWSRCCRSRGRRTRACRCRGPPAAPRTSSRMISRIAMTTKREHAGAEPSACGLGRSRRHAHRAGCYRWPPAASVRTSRTHRQPCWMGRRMLLPGGEQLAQRGRFERIVGTIRTGSAACGDYPAQFRAVRCRVVHTARVGAPHDIFEAGLEIL